MKAPAKPSPIVVDAPATRAEVRGANVPAESAPAPPTDLVRAPTDLLVPAAAKDASEPAARTPAAR